MTKAAAQKIHYFKDLETSLAFGNAKADQRVQIKMPRAVVQELDALFKDIDRSHLLTQLAVHAINQKLAFQDRPILRELAADEQAGLDTMINYLEKRDAGNA